MASDIGMELAEDVSETTASTLAAIGLRIRATRQRQGMTLQKLGEESGLSPSMLSLVERGRASPSIGSLIVISNALGVTMSDLVTGDATPDSDPVVRVEDQQIVETADHVVRRLIRQDRSRGVSIAINEYAPHTGSAPTPITHDGYEYGFVLEGELTVEVEGTAHKLRPGDLISYESRRPHRIWNHSRRQVRTLWFNLDRK